MSSISKYLFARYFEFLACVFKIASYNLIELILAEHSRFKYIILKTLLLSSRFNLFEFTIRRTF